MPINPGHWACKRDPDVSLIEEILYSCTSETLMNKHSLRPGTENMNNARVSFVCCTWQCGTQSLFSASPHLPTAEFLYFQLVYQFLNIIHCCLCTHLFPPSLISSNVSPWVSFTLGTLLTCPHYCFKLVDFVPITFLKASLAKNALKNIGKGTYQMKTIDWHALVLSTADVRLALFNRHCCRCG